MRSFVTEDRICIYLQDSSFGANCIEADLLDDSFWVARVFVKPSARGRGFGKLMMKELCRILDERGWHAHLIPNPYDETIDYDRLVRFYERFGFAWDSLCMRREPRAIASIESQHVGNSATASQNALQARPAAMSCACS